MLLLTVPFFLDGLDFDMILMDVVVLININTLDLWNVLVRVFVL